MLFEPDIVFASEPVLHSALKMIQGNAIACLQKTLRDGQRVVEDGVVSEVSHGEAIDPADGAWTSRAGCVDGFDMKPAGEHGSFVSGEESEQRRVDWDSLDWPGKFSSALITAEDRDRG